jgi:hypothetical protein
MRYAINLDWLSLTLRGAVACLKECPVGFRAGAFTFVVTDGSTRHYKHVANIQYKGAPWANICFAPHSAILPADSCSMKLENCVLYEEGLIDTFREFFTETGFKIQSIARLDIAFDFEKFLNGWTAQEFVNQLTNNQIQKKGRPAQFNTHYKGAVLTGCRWGSMASDRAFVLYNKTLELQNKNKVYITDYHKRNDLGTAGELCEKTETEIFPDVWRLEARLKSPELKKLFKCTIGDNIADENGEQVRTMSLDLFDFLRPDWLAQVFEKELESYLTFVYPQTDEEKALHEPRHALGLIMLTHKTLALTRCSTKPSAGLFRVKVSIKSLLENYYRFKNERAFSMACEVIEENSLMEFVDKRLSHWKREFFGGMDSNYNYLEPVKQIALAKHVEQLQMMREAKAQLEKEPVIALQPTVWRRLKYQTSYVQPTY